MHLPQTILVPTDFSECAQEALEYALQLAKHLDARVCIVHAFLVPIVGWEGAWAFPADALTQIETDARDKLKAALDKARETLPTITATFFDGDPREAVPKVALQIKADLIVMGTHGRTGLSRVIMGSVTESVIRHAPCAVLAFRHPKDVGL